jgi:hypothetical protein
MDRAGIHGRFLFQSASMDDSSERGRREAGALQETAGAGEPAPGAAAAGTPFWKNRLAFRELLRLVFQAGVLLFKPLHTSRGVHDLLLPRHEWVALGAYFGFDILLRGPCRDDIPANTGNGGFLVFRMDSLFHNEPFSFSVFVTDRLAEKILNPVGAKGVDYSPLRCKLKQYLFPVRKGASASGHPVFAKRAYWFMESRKS